jgi:hypothetical protein
MEDTILDPSPYARGESDLEFRREDQKFQKYKIHHYDKAGKGDDESQAEDVDVPWCVRYRPND